MSASSWDEAVPLAASPAVAAERARWNPLTRIAFRFAFAYFVLYNFPFPLDLIPFAAPVAEWYDSLWHTLVTAVAQRFFGITITVFTNGSGDTTYDYVKLLCIVGIAAIATLLWSLLDRRRLAYPRLFAWLRVYVRFSLAAAMVAYGAAKVIQSQFPAPPLDRLMQPFGDASPMGLLWTFMGASAAYNLFTGAGELLGGLLLTTRRTALLGALVSIAVMANIVALNFCYDVPVKLYSTNLLVTGIFIVLPDARRLLDFFVLHAPPPPMRAKWLRVSGVALRTALVIVFVGMMLQQARDGRRTWGDLSPRSPLRGIWTVDTVTVDGVERPVTLNDTARWRRVIFDARNVMAFQTMNDARTRYSLVLDEKKGTMHLTSRDNPKQTVTFSYRRPDPRSLQLDGAMDGHQYHAVLHAIAAAPFRLTTRGFHWINESPFNR
jgi:hypothetical protein